MRAEHEIRMVGEPAIDANGAFVRVRGPHFFGIEPRGIALGFANLALSEEEDVDDNIGSGICAETALRQADRRDQVGGFCDVLARGEIRLVHRAVRGHECGKCAGLQEINRTRDEVIVQAKTLGAIGPVRSDGSVGKGRIADREIEGGRQLGPCEIASEDACSRLE